MADQAGEVDYVYEHVMGRLSHAEYLEKALLADDSLFVPLELIRAGLADEMKKRLVEAFWEMDKLDRSDTFWKQSNMLPVYSRIPEFVALQISRRIKVPEYSWFMILLLLIGGERFFILEYWEALRGSDAFDPVILSRLSYAYYVNTGVDSSKAFARFGLKLFSRESIEMGLKELPLQDERAKRWAESVRSVLTSWAARS